MKMNKVAEQHESDASGKFHTVQPLRDLQSNWAVDLAKNLEDYLLKICSGEITSSNQDVPSFSINFAEAALLLQGSVQVYSRKVEYLHSLVLHALDFISQNSSQEQAKSGSSQPGEDADHPPNDVEDDSFWDLDDILVEPKNLLDVVKDATSNVFVRPPANLVVFEGDCLDTNGDAGELESYLLATTDLYREFLLLDPCDAAVVNDFLNRQNKDGKYQANECRGGSRSSKSRNSFKSPTGCSGGTGSKLSAAKNLDAGHHRDAANNGCEEPMKCDGGFSSPAFDDGNGNHMFNMENDYPDSIDSDDVDDFDPWKPLNPHEPGTLKIKPYKRVKATKKTRANPQKARLLMAEFPLATPDGPIGVELTKVWEEKRALEKQEKPKSPSRYEKLRQSLTERSKEDNSFFSSTDADDNGDNEDPEIDPPDFGMPENAYTYEDMPHENKDDGGNIHLDNDEIHEDNNAHTSLEDLCRSHLDSLLANLGETEKQSEMATRVSTWKQRIEQSLEEEDSHPSFDIHEYGGRVLSKLCKAGVTGGDTVSFTNVVEGYDKPDVARTFLALLQLVNNGDVRLEKNVCKKNSESFCFTAESPFYVCLVKNMKIIDEDEEEEIEQHPLVSKKGAAAKSSLSPKGFRLNKGRKHKIGNENHSVLNNLSSPDSLSTSSKSRKVVGGGKKCTPEGKKRRRFIEESVNL